MAYIDSIHFQMITTKYMHLNSMKVHRTKNGKNKNQITNSKRERSNYNENFHQHTLSSILEYNGTTDQGDSSNKE